jgi:molybdopterin synthase catalytic subunit
MRPAADSGIMIVGTIVERPIEVERLVQQVASAAAGASSLFVGPVRDSSEGRPVVGIDYQAYGPMAERELRAIIAEASERFGTLGIAVEHRIGFLAIGEISVAIAASHARRSPAIDAARYVIEQIKRRLPIWKREHYSDGTREWIDPTKPLALAVATVGDGGSQ